MVKKFFVVFFTVAITGILGCNNSDIEEVTETTTTFVEESIIPTTTKKEVTTIAEEERGKGQIINIMGEGDADRLGVEKTLVWIVPDETGDSCPRNDAAVRELNTLLVTKYGCDFVVEFHTYDSIMSIKNKNYQYYDMVLDMKELGHQADILYSGNSNEYQSLVEADIYEPLTEYFLTEEGHKLYNAYAEEMWKQTEWNGDSHGYVSKIYPAGRAVAMCNSEVAAKYGINVEDNWSFYDIGSFLEGVKIDKSDKISDTIIPLACNPTGLLNIEGYHVEHILSDYILFKEDAEYGWVAVNPAEEVELIRLWETIKEYYDKGWYINVDGNDMSVFKSRGNFIFNIDLITNTILVGDKWVASDDSIFEMEIGNVVYCANELATNMVVGVTSWSEYKEDALKLITLIQTNTELSNLIRFGIEGEDYVYEKGILDALPGKEIPSLPLYYADLSNIGLTYSVLAEPDDKLEYSKEISSNYPDGACMMYDIDISKYKEQMQNVIRVHIKYNNTLFSGTSEDLDSTIANMKEEYEAAGLNEIVAEINRQIKEQKADE